MRLILDKTHKQTDKAQKSQLNRLNRPRGRSVRQKQIKYNRCSLIVYRSGAQAKIQNNFFLNDWLPFIHYLPGNLEVFFFQAMWHYRRITKGPKQIDYLMLMGITALLTFHWLDKATTPNWMTRYKCDHIPGHHGRPYYRTQPQTIFQHSRPAPPAKQEHDTVCPPLQGCGRFLLVHLWVVLLILKTFITACSLDYVWKILEELSMKWMDRPSVT